MKKSLVISLSAAIIFAAGLVFVPTIAQAQSKHSSSGKGNVKQDETVYVVQIGDEYKAIKKSDRQTEKKKLEDDYKQAIKEWQDSRKLDPKASRPTKPIWK